MGWCSIKEGDKKEFVRIEGDKKEFVRIEGDKVENTPSDSFVEGLLKGAGVVVTGGAYPLLTGALKAYSFYTDINNAATKDMQEKNEWTVTKTSLKGALLGAVKGTLHGVLDSMVIG